MRVQISHPELLPELLAFLRLRSDTVVDQVGENELQVSVLGSHGQEALHVDLELRLRVWQVAHPGVRVEVRAGSGGRRRRGRLWLV